MYSNAQDLARLMEVYETARTVKSGKHWTTVNELTDQIPATRPDTLMAAVRALLNMGPVGLNFNKILAEEDKGASIASVFSVLSNLPLAMARIYSYEIPGTIKVPLNMEYYTGMLLVNGVEKGDRLLLVDDTLSTGGTILALASAAKQVGACVTEIRVVVEKIGYGGRERIYNELNGLQVQSALLVEVDNEGRIEVRTHGMRSRA